MKKMITIFLTIMMIGIAAIKLTHAADAAKASVPKSNVDCSIVAGNGLVIGGSINCESKDVSEITPYITGDEKYTLIKGFKAVDKNVKGSKVKIEDPCQVSMIELASKKDYDVAISCNWNLFPRVPIVQSNTSITYKKVITEILKRNGINDPNPTIKQNYAIDLDNDGQREVLINASNIDYNNPKIKTKAGNYSVTLVRKMIKGKVEDILLSYYFVPSNYTDNGKVKNDDAYKIITIADVNNDNKLEVIIGEVYYEGYVCRVFDLNGDKPIELFSNGFAA